MNGGFAPVYTRGASAFAGAFCLRHSYATRCVERGVDVKSVSEMLGHSDVRITLQTYVHVSLRPKQQAVQSICFLPICGGDFAPSEIPSGKEKAAVRQGAAAQVS